MCFSTEVSFTAAALLAGAGAITWKKCRTKSLLFLAATPFLFAIQQLSEGLLWLHLTGHLKSLALFSNSMGIFLTFAFLIWPIWIPLCLVLPEKVYWRKYLIGLMLFCGICLSSINLSYALFQSMNVQIVNHSIQYIGNAPPQTMIYPLIVLIPCFVSSLKNMWIFGLFVTLGYALAQYTYSTTFVSVWCFFAACVSTIIYIVIRDNQNALENNSGTVGK